MNHFKINLKNRISEKRFSFANLSKQSGVPKTNIHSWLMGSNPNLCQLKRVADTLTIGLDDLVSGKDHSCDKTAARHYQLEKVSIIPYNVIGRIL